MEPLVEWQMKNIELQSGEELKNKKERGVGLRLSRGETQMACARECLLVDNHWSLSSVIFFCLWQQLSQ